MIRPLVHSLVRHLFYPSIDFWSTRISLEHLIRPNQTQVRAQEEAATGCHHRRHLTGLRSRLLEGESGADPESRLGSGPSPHNRSHMQKWHWIWLKKWQLRQARPKPGKGNGARISDPGRTTDPQRHRPAPPDRWLGRAREGVFQGSVQGTGFYRSHSYSQASSASVDNRRFTNTNNYNQYRGRAGSVSSRGTSGVGAASEDTGKGRNNRGFRGGFKTRGLQFKISHL